MKPTVPEMKRVTESLNGVATEGQRMQVMTITPDLAAHWLAQGGKNRNVSRHRVATFAGAMRRGEWRLTFEAIKLDTSGQLRDGQHRLSAVVESKIPIEALVIYGVDEAAFEVMDSGRPRTVGDNMLLQGEERSTALAAALRFLVLWERDHSKGVLQGFQTAVSVPQANEALERYPEVRHWVNVAGQLHRAGIKGGAGLWAGLLTLFSRKDATDAQLFAERVHDGTNLAPGNPILTLRKQLFNNPITTKHQTRTAVWIIKAWNATRAGDHVYQLKWGTDERFPEPE